MTHFFHEILKKSSIVILSVVILAYQHLLFADENHQHHTMCHAKQIVSPTIKLDIQKIILKGKQRLVRIKLTDLQNHKPIRLDDLNEIHTQKIHLLIIDEGLSDYTHVHPQATSKAGVYQFTWHPMRKNATYRIWADLVPTKTNRQEYLIGTLLSSTKNPIKKPYPLSYVSTIDRYTFKLSFDQKQLQVGEPVIGTIQISDAKSNPVRSLEPLMGAYAHIVGFSDDFKTVVHIHPMGTEPQHSSDKGGPELQFHIVPEKAGFIKLYAQMKIKGKELLIPFGIQVYPS